jgi:hypothetical protein
MWEILERGRGVSLFSSSFLTSSLSLFLFSWNEQEPWGGRTNIEVIEAVLNGEQLPKPKNCPPELFNIMTKCWNDKPDNRPSFRELLDDLLQFSNSLNMKNSIFIDDVQGDPAIQAEHYLRDPSLKNPYQTSPV